MDGAMIFNLVAALALGILSGLGAFAAKEAIAEKIAHKRITRELLAQALHNKAFASEELIREADKMAHDEEESDAARDFAKRVYIIGRTAQIAKEEQEDE